MSVTRWEYKKVAFWNEVESEGLSGWELVMRSSVNGGNPYGHYILKRPLED